MVDIVYRFGDDHGGAADRPADAAEARELLEYGNAAFAGLFTARPEGSPVPVLSVLGRGFGSPDEPAEHEPFAAVLTCADARVPTELLFARAVNELFVLRVAGNVLGSGVIGSLNYAMEHLPTVQLVVVLGHSRCGAVTSAVDNYLDPAAYLGLAAQHQLRNIMHQLFPAVRLAHHALHDVHGQRVAGAVGFRPALIEVAAVLNAAIKASSVRGELKSYGVPPEAAVFGVYDLVTRRVGIPAEDSAGRPRTGLHLPPEGAPGFLQLAASVADGPVVHEVLAGRR